MIDQIFHVATEFKFDIGSALLDSQALAGAVGGISTSADQAVASLNYLKGGLIASLGFGSGGLLTILSKAVMVSDKFNNSTFSFSNVISSNMKNLQGNVGTFNERLAVSALILEDISKKANEFALPSGELLNMTKVLAPILIPHGAAGKNMSTAIDLSRMVLKSAPNLNINPAESEGQLIRAISGQAHMGDTLFRRLLSEAPAPFKEARMNNASAFNAAPFDKRLKVLQGALAKFSSDTDVTTARVNSLSGQMTLLSNNFTEFGSILRPLGDAFLKPVVKVLQGINSVAMNEGKKIVASMGQMVANLLEDPKKLLINVLQLQKLAGDVKTSSKLMGAIELILVARQMARWLPMNGIIMTAIGKGLSFLGNGLKAIAMWIPWLSIFSFAAQAVWFVFSKLLPGVLAITALMQTVSRAQAIAKVNDAQGMLTLGPKFADLFVRMKVAIENIFMPIMTVIDALANFIAPLFEISTWGTIALTPLEKFTAVLEFLGKVSILAMAGFQGLAFAIMQLINNVITLIPKPIRESMGIGTIGGGDSGSIGTAFNAGIDDVLERNRSRLLGEGGGVSNHVTNIGKVEIRNDFKENQEPDRIAFSLVNQLKKVSKNPTQGKGTGLSNAFAR